jgi:hypothetical protein
MFRTAFKRPLKWAYAIIASAAARHDPNRFKKSFDLIRARIPTGLEAAVDGSFSPPLGCCSFFIFLSYSSEICGK